MTNESQTNEQQAEHPDAPSLQTSLRWDWMENATQKLDQLPEKIVNKLGVSTASFLGLLGLFCFVALCYTLVLTPLKEQPFGSPYLYTPQMAKSFVPHSKLAHTKLVKQPGVTGLVKYTAAYTFVYTTGYLLPYFFSAKLKKPDLLLFALRGLFVGILLLFSIRLFFAKEEEPLPATD